MASPIPARPEVLYAFRAPGQLESVEAAVACVDCALEGDPSSLTAVYTVSGTVLCKTHAVRERERQLAAPADQRREHK